ncbi:Septum site-determining protein MinD [Posidoniimonas polymericola]|uniref:Septum site-determining protein MinD n=1 Tax=Posidoniimonas polymericola TaxID=2528002 RepID=A0A5C5YQ12_9BACT|nr:AAA family ATPase [Posidoniimonas polymericola]TWT76850.1 Septum site-determining protein MinD [Posidoniimonas polymericola]
MSNVLRLAIVDPNDATRESLKSTLMGLETVWLEAECSRYAFFKDVLEQTNPDVGFIAIDGDPDEAVRLVEELAHAKPSVSLLVSSSSTDGNLILRTMRAGAKEFLPNPIKPEDLASALQRVSRTKFGAVDGKNRGCQVTVVAGATGGVGATSLAVNLGCQLASDPSNSVVLLDLDLALGDADVFLDSIPEYTLTDVAQNITRLDFTLLKRSLTKHSTNLYLLPRPVQLEDSQLVTTDDLTRVIGLLKATFSHLIIDASKSFQSLDLLAMEQADNVLMVTQLDLPCLRNVVRLLMSFEQMGGLNEKIKIVVNRVGQGGASISIKKAQETLGREIYWQLPNDYKTMIEVRNNGVPLIEQAPKAAITSSISQLADSLTGKQSSVAPAELAGKGRNWLGLWGKGAKAPEAAAQSAE